MSKTKTPAYNKTSQTPTRTAKQKHPSAPTSTHYKHTKKITENSRGNSNSKMKALPKAKTSQAAPKANEGTSPQQTTTRKTIKQPNNEDNPKNPNRPPPHQQAEQQGNKQNAPPMNCVIGHLEKRYPTKQTKRHTIQAYGPYRRPVDRLRERAYRYRPKAGLSGWEGLTEHK